MTRKRILCHFEERGDEAISAFSTAPLSLVFSYFSQICQKVVEIEMKFKYFSFELYRSVCKTVSKRIGSPFMKLNGKIPVCQRNVRLVS